MPADPYEHLRSLAQHHGFVLVNLRWSRAHVLELEWDLVSWEQPHAPAGRLSMELSDVERSFVQLAMPSPSGPVPQEVWLSHRDPLLPWRGDRAVLELTARLRDPWAFLGELTFALDALAPGVCPLSLMPGAEDLRAWWEATQVPPHTLMAGPLSLVRVGEKILREAGEHGRVLAPTPPTDTAPGHLVVRWGESWALARRLRLWGAG